MGLSGLWPFFSAGSSCLPMVLHLLEVVLADEETPDTVGDATLTEPHSRFIHTLIPEWRGSGHGPAARRQAGASVPPKSRLWRGLDSVARTAGDVEEEAGRRDGLRPLVRQPCGGGTSPGQRGLRPEGRQRAQCRWRTVAGVAERRAAPSCRRRCERRRRPRGGGGPCPAGVRRDGIPADAAAPSVQRRR